MDMEAIVSWVILGAVAIAMAIITISFPFHFGLFLWRLIKARRNLKLHKIKYSWLFEHAILTFIALILAAIAIPNFLKFQDHPKYVEAKINLGAIYVAQLSYFSYYNTYAGGPDAFTLINWEPAGQTRYAYYCQGAMIPNKLPMRIDYVPKPEGRWPITAKPQSSKSGFTCMAVGNIDNDPDLDVWSINDGKILRNDSNDVSN